MRNSRICPENNARFFNLMCENVHRAALTLSLHLYMGCRILVETSMYKHVKDSFSPRWAFYLLSGSFSPKWVFFSQVGGFTPGLAFFLQGGSFLGMTRP